MRTISTDLGSIYSSLDLRLDKFESNVSKAIQGFYKLQTGTEKASSIMDKSVYTAISNIAKSYELWERANERTGKSIFDNSKKIASYQERIKLLDDEIKKSEKTLEDIEKQCGKNSKEAEEYKSHMLDLKISHAELTEELKKAERETGTLAGRLDILGKELDKINEKHKALDIIGNKFSSLGNKLTMGVTLPLLGAGTAATKFAMDFGTGMAKVSTIADTTKVPIEKLKEGVVSLSNATATSTNELNEALYETLSAGIDTAHAVDFVGTAVKAAKGGFADTATAVDGLTTVLNSYGLSATEANKIANQMLISQNLGKTTFNELASTIGKVTPIAAALGITTEELFSSLASTTSQGLATAESVTALKAAMSNIIKPSKEASEAARMLGIEFSTSAVKSKGWIGFLQEVRKKLKEAAPTYDDALMRQEKYTRLIAEAEKAGNKNNKQLQEYKEKLKEAKQEIELLTQAQDSTIGGFATLFGSVEGLNSVLMLTSENGMNLYNESMRQMKENTGALDDAYNKMADTTETRFNKALNQAKNSAMELGVKLLPTIEKGVDLLSRLADWLGNLSPATQEWVIKIGLATAALGPFVSAIGGTVKGIGGLLSTGEKIGTFFGLFQGATSAAGAVSGLGTAATVAAGTSTGGGILGLGSALSSIAGAAGPMALFTLGVAGAGYGIYKLGEALTTDTSPKVKLFDKTISQSTQEAVTKYLDMEKDINITLKQWQSSQNKITKEMYTDLEKKLSEMHSLVTTKTNKISTDSVNIVKERLMEINAATTQEGAKLLQGLEEFGKSQQNTIKSNNEKILAIYKEASANNRQVTSEENTEIQRLMEENRRAAVQILSDSELGQLTILNNLKNEKNKIAEIEARDSIERSAKTMAETIAIETEKHKKLVEAIQKAYPLMSDEEKKAADEILTISEQTKKDKILNAELTHARIMDLATEHGRRLTNYAENTTAEIIQKDERLKEYWRNSYYPEKFLKYMMSVGVSGGSGGGGGRQNTIGMNARGTDYWRGGLTWIDEEGSELIQLPGSGPKLVDLPRGTKIFNNNKSEQMKKRLMDQQQSTSSSIGIVPRKLDFFNLDGFSSTPDFQKKNLEAVKSKYDKLYGLNDLGAAGLNIKTNSQSEELAKMSLSIANQIEKLEILKREHAETKNLLGGNSKEVLELEKRMISLNLEIENNKKALEQATVNSKFKAYYDELELAMISLGVSSRNTSEEFTKQENILQLQKEKLEVTRGKYEELRTILGDDSDEVIRLRKEIASLSVEITNNSNALNQAKIRNIFKSTYEEIELALISLNRSTKSFSEEVKKQEEIYSKNFFKLITMKEEYKMLSVVLGESSNEVKNLKKEIASLSIELENNSDKLKMDTINFINSFNNNLIEALRNRYNKELQLQEESINKELENLDNWKDESLKRINDVYDNKIKAIEESSNAQVKALEDEIKAIDEAERQKDRAEIDSEELKKINRLKEAMEFEHTEFNKAELQKELNKLIQDREKRLHKESIEDKKEALKNQIDIIKENAQRQKQQLELDKKYELERITSIYEFNKQSLNNQLDNVRKFYENKTSLANLQAESEKLIVDNNQKEIVELIKSYSPKYEEAGKTLGERMAEGFKGKLQSVISMIEGIESKINALRDTDIQNAAASMNYVPYSISNNNGTSVINTNSSSVVNHNNITFNSPKALSPAETRRQTETTLRNLSFV